jgi:hypothetical protein
MLDFFPPELPISIFFNTFFTREGEERPFLSLVVSPSSSFTVTKWQKHLSCRCERLPTNGPLAHGYSQPTGTPRMTTASPGVCRTSPKSPTTSDILRHSPTLSDILRHSSDKLRHSSDRLRQTTTNYDKLRQTTTNSDKLRQTTTSSDKLRQTHQQSTNNNSDNNDNNYGALANLPKRSK